MLFADGLHVVVRLVVAGGDHVRDADRVPSVLLRVAAGDLRQDHEVEGHPRIPPGGAHLRGRQGDHSEVGLSIYTLTHQVVYIHSIQ